MSMPSTLLAQPPKTETLPSVNSPDSESILINPVMRLAQMCDVETSHSHHTTFLALRLFDELQPIHQMGATERFWLQAGGLLHDIGWVDGGRSHHKTSLRIILSTPMLPFTNKERLIIGSIARYHRKGLPKQKHANFAALTAVEQLQTSILAGFLRLADGLDFDHGGLITDLKCQLSDRKIDLLLFSRQISEEILVPAIAKSDLLRKALKRDIRFNWSSA
jgi:exopolyphosphatase/guanosine-5'-triphosphate,3'-diphosphate pyrophosphatase